MKPATFWTFFTSGYGTCWILLLSVAFLTQSHLETGVFGLIGFPILALFYALYRKQPNSDDAKTPSFFTYFSSCIGGIFLLILAISLLTGSHINAGLVGLIAFPIISTIYALWRLA